MTSPTPPPELDPAALEAARYRKKPVEVDARQFFPTDLPWPDGVEGYQREVVQTLPGDTHLWNAWRIATLEGVMEVRPGDWIIRGVKGETYPCKPDIFEMTYEPLTASRARGEGDDFERGWKPIESAPEDGTWVLVCQYTPGLGNPLPAIASQDQDGVWRWEPEHNPCSVCWTHWMPLPASPSLDRNGE